MVIKYTYVYTCIVKLASLSLVPSLGTLLGENRLNQISWTCSQKLVRTNEIVNYL